MVNGFLSKYNESKKLLSLHCWMSAITISYVPVAVLSTQERDWTCFVELSTNWTEMLWIKCILNFELLLECCFLITHILRIFCLMFEEKSHGFDTKNMHLVSWKSLMTKLSSRYSKLNSWDVNSAGFGWPLHLKSHPAPNQVINHVICLLSENQI